MPARTTVAAKYNGPVGRLLREERGLSQASLAHSVGTHRAHLSRVEAGKKQPSRDLVKRIASVLCVPMAALLIDPNIEED